MTFYIKPPRGNIALQKLHQSVEQRLELLLSLTHTEGKESCPLNFEYFIEGSPLDRASHFVLRLLSLASGDLEHAVLSSEKVLFKQRLDLLRSSDIWSHLKTLQRHVLEALSEGRHDKDSWKTLQVTLDVCKWFFREKTWCHVFRAGHGEDCEVMQISVPFRMCLPLVSSRMVHLHSGFAVIPCGKWKVILELLFEYHLKSGMKTMQCAPCFRDALSDPRLRELSSKLQSKMNQLYISDKKLRESKGEIKSCEIDEHGKYFPLCMLHLLRTLRARHRLTHESRFHLSLFLKDIGMPAREAIQFWKKEYSEPHKACGTCTHSWQKDSKKYEYSIRHMYGMEGSRRSYTMPSCRYIQSKKLTPLSEGGCPFVHFDESGLVGALPRELWKNETHVQKLLDLKRSNEAQKACRFYLSVVSSNTSSFHESETRLEEIGCGVASAKVESSDVGHQHSRFCTYDINISNHNSVYIRSPVDFYMLLKLGKS